MHRAGHRSGKKKAVRKAGMVVIRVRVVPYTVTEERFIQAGLPLQSSAMLSEEAKDKLRQALQKVHDWPSVYMYKFIFEPDEERLNELLAMFPAESEILRKYSSSGKYLSITVKEVMMSADDVVARYDKASEIPGVITL
jgi:hypothetical protein